MAAAYRFALLAEHNHVNCLVAAVALLSKQAESRPVFSTDAVSTQHLAALECQLKPQARLTAGHPRLTSPPRCCVELPDFLCASDSASAPCLAAPSAFAFEKSAFLGICPCMLEFSLLAN